MSASVSSPASSDGTISGPASGEAGSVAARRPQVTPEFLANITATVPSRLLKRLDATPTLAEGWSWTRDETGWLITTDSGEKVRLSPDRGAIRTPEQAVCSCLLAPRCLHLLASLSVLEPGEGGALESSASDAAEPEASTAPMSAHADDSGTLESSAVTPTSTLTEAVSVDPSGPVAAAPSGALSAASSGAMPASLTGAETPLKGSLELDRKVPKLLPEQARALQALWLAGVRLLDAGAHGAGAVVQAGLLRAIHEARAVGLHRLASTGIRVVQQVKMLRSGSAAFRLERLQAAVLELLDVAERLMRLTGPAPALQAGSSPEPISELLGRGRREYVPVGNLQLYGLFTFPVISFAGYAGVVTLLVDGGGRLWSLSDVYPGEASRARAALDASTSLGELHLSHRQLGRERIFLQSATGSSDGRIGSGGGVQAARGGPSRWTDAIPDRLWQVPVSIQVARAFQAVARGESERRVGDDFLFLEATVLGPSPGGLLLQLMEGAGGIVEARYPSDAESLRFLEGFKILASAPGVRIRLIGQLEPRAPRALQLLAVGAVRSLSPAPDADAHAPLRLPEGLLDRLSLGVEVLERGFLPGRPSTPPPGLLPDWPDPLVVLRRWLGRLVLGGRDALPVTALPMLEREAKALEQQLMPGAATALRRLADCQGRGAHFDPVAGRSDSGNTGEAEKLGLTWLTLARYEQGAWGHLLQGLWEQPQQVQG